MKNIYMVQLSGIYDFIPFDEKYFFNNEELATKKYNELLEKEKQNIDFDDEDIEIEEEKNNFYSYLSGESMVFSINIKLEKIEIIKEA